MEKILGKKTEPTLLYKVKWAGYPVSEATWEPLANLDNVQDMVEEFDQICEEKLLALCAKDIGGQGIGQEPGSTHEEEKSMKGFKKTYNIGQHLEISGPKYLAMPLPEQHATKKGKSDRE